MCLHTVYLGLGSNLGDGKKNLEKALELLSQRVGEIVRVSSFIESEPWGFQSEHTFTNGAVSMLTNLSPFQLLDETQAIEREMGRTHKHKPGEGYKDRIIDIDILYYDELVMKTERLTLPHPLIEERDFVKIPLKDIKIQL